MKFYISWYILSYLLGIRSIFDEIEIFMYDTTGGGLVALNNVLKILGKNDRMGLCQSLCLPGGGGGVIVGVNGVRRMGVVKRLTCGSPRRGSHTIETGVGWPERTERMIGYVLQRGTF